MLQQCSCKQRPPEACVKVRCCQSGFATACDALLMPTPCPGFASDSTVSRAAAASSAAALSPDTSAMEKDDPYHSSPRPMSWQAWMLALLCPHNDVTSYVHSSLWVYDSDGMLTCGYVQLTSPAGRLAMVTICCRHLLARACPRIASPRVSQPSSETACVCNSCMLSVS